MAFPPQQPRGSALAEGRDSGDRSSQVFTPGTVSQQQQFRTLLARLGQSELTWLSRQMVTVPIGSILLTGGISSEQGAGVGEVSAGQVAGEHCHTMHDKNSWGKSFG